jgi:hypothetical protein
MNPDAIVLAMLAVGDLALIVHLRQRHGQQVKMERVMTSLRMAVRRENGVETLPVKRPLLRAS